MHACGYAGAGVGAAASVSGAPLTAQDGPATCDQWAAVEASAPAGGAAARDADVVLRTNSCVFGRWDCDATHAAAATWRKVSLSLSLLKQIDCGA